MKTKNASGALNLILGEMTAAVKILPQVFSSVEAAAIFVRWLFSFLETFAFLLGQLAIEDADRIKVELTAAERNALTFVSEPTVPNAAPPRRSHANLRATLTAGVNVLARARRVPSPLKDGLPPEFIATSHLHDRLAYPTDAEDLKIRRDDLQTTAKLLEWLRDLIAWVNKQRLAQIDEIKEESRRSFEEARRKILGNDNSGE